MSGQEDRALEELAEEEGYSTERETAKTSVQQQTKERDDTQS
jgi:hypothetical protein